MILLEHRQDTVDLIGEAVEQGARLSLACDEAGIAPCTYRRWQHRGTAVEDKRPAASRPEPANKLSHQERTTLLAVFHQDEFKSMPPSQVVPVLADEGVFLASESTCYRVLHEANQQHDRGRARQRERRSKPAEYAATAPNQAWCWDVTWLRGPARGMFFYLYMIMDVFSRKVVGWEVYERECGELASVLVRRTVMSEGCLRCPDILHADNGSPQKSSTLRATLEQLGIEPTYSRPRVSNDNPYSESLFRTTKYRPDYPAKGFNDLEEARRWVLKFVRWYNEEHRHSAIKFVTPVQRHTGADIEILAARTTLYERAKVSKPERWSGEIRDWTRPSVVTLNPDNPTTKNGESLQEVG